MNAELYENDEQNEPDERASDRFVERLLDDDRPPTEGGSEEFEQLPAEERGTVVELLFLNSLLERLFRPDLAADAARLERVRLAIDAEPQPVPVEPATIIHPRRRRRLWYSVSAAAITVLILTGWVVWQNRTPAKSAAAAVQTALNDLNNAPDREYRLTVFLSRAPRPIEAALYIRGRERFALKHPGIIGDHWLGSDGRQHWFVPAIGPVVVGEDSALIRKLFDRRTVSTPFLQVTTILSRLRDRYRLELLPDVEVPWGDDGKAMVLCQRVRGVLRDPAEHEPHTIELCAGRQSGIAHRLVLQWRRPHGARGLQEVRMEFVGETELADEFYRHESHHGPQRILLDPPGDDPA